MSQHMWMYSGSCRRTSTSGGKLIFHIFSALAEFERELIQERTGAGLKAARARGRLGGRPPMLDNRGSVEEPPKVLNLV
jgi:DNA invertase Pin-like site-specific DNA recombinase